ncbi:MAG: ChbG/HpnK family deacetylase [bacterium]|nr:ChbG/HpnK family deacetylase [bacterium]MDW8164574.1 ChbG/HpnK family deacetylase [Candidatus Omnitrophota bacterium]
MEKIILYTRGDDCGISLSTNLAIFNACKYGILKNISLIANSPYIKNAYEILKDLKDVSFGIHITLTCEWKNIKWGPILGKERVPSIVDENGFFYPDSKILYEKKPSRKDMEREIEAQFEYLETLGFEIVYADVHMGIGWIYNIEEYIKNLCRKKKILFVDNLYKKFPNFEFGFEGFLKTLENLSNGEYLLITHPTLKTSEMRLYSTFWEDAGSIIRKRVFDTEILTDEKVKEIIERKNIKLKKFEKRG